MTDPGPTRDELWPIYDRYRTVRLNVLYYGHQLRRYQRISFWLKVAIAAVTSSTVIGMAIGLPHWGKWTWVVFAAVVAILSIVKLLMQLAEMIARYSRLYAGYHGMFHSLEKVVTDISIHHEIRPESREAVANTEDLYLKLAGEDDPAPSRALRIKFTDEVNEEIPSSRLWWPPSTLHPLSWLLVLITLGWGAAAQSAEPVAPVASERFHSPREAVHWALADILTIPSSEDRLATRYLSLYNLPTLRDREDLIRVVNVWINSLSVRNRIITPVTVVPQTDNTLLRVFLENYADPDDHGQDLERLEKAWDSLGANGSGPTISIEKIATPEPWFHLQVDHTQKAVNWIVHDPSLDPREVLELSRQTQTFFPVFRADWFVATSSLGPAYYDLLGIRSLKDAETVALFSADAERKLAVRGVQAHRSEVALHNRAASWAPTPAGSFWQTFDYKKAIQDADLLADILQQKRDATEAIWNNLNGLQGYLVADGQGKLLDFADTAIARDKDTQWSRAEVWTAASCVHCHTRGIKDFDDTVRSLAHGDISLLVADPHRARQVAKLFSVPIDDPVHKSQTAYTQAIAAASGGWTPVRFIARFQQVFLSQWEDDVTLETAARDVGYPPELVRAAIRRAVGVDHTLTQLLQGDPVRPEQWQDTGVAQLRALMIATAIPQPPGKTSHAHSPTLDPARHSSDHAGRDPQ